MPEHVELSVSGMMCGGCEGSVKKILELHGVANPTASHEEKKVTFDHDGADVEAIKAAIVKAGYTVSA